MVEKETLKKIAYLLMGSYGINYSIRGVQLVRARFYARSIGKPLLNISCGKTGYGDVNADITPQNVPNFRLIDANGPLPFPDKIFGAVYSSHTIEHTDDPYEFYNELVRVADRVFLAYPTPLDITAFAPFHKWVNLDFQGKSWLANPFYNAKIDEMISKLNLWRSPKIIDQIVKFTEFLLPPSKTAQNSQIDDGE